MLVVVLIIMLLLVVLLLLGPASNVSADTFACASHCPTSMAATCFHIDV